MAERDKITKINQSGVEARATVDLMQETGTQLGGGHPVDFQLTVHPERARINGLRRPCDRRRGVEASGLEPESQDPTRRLLQA